MQCTQCLKEFPCRPFKRSTTTVAPTYFSTAVNLEENHYASSPHQKKKVKKPIRLKVPNTWRDPIEPFETSSEQAQTGLPSLETPTIAFPTVKVPVPEWHKKPPPPMPKPTEKEPHLVYPRSGH